MESCWYDERGVGHKTKWSGHVVCARGLFLKPLSRLPALRCQARHIWIAPHTSMLMHDVTNQAVGKCRGFCV
jgi:hypothetical protein